ncbi:MAG: biotin--[acetyl-CoA-carboxylase] ligase [Bacteroidales bacterium]|nr:biotin--[acetyl-CoA-carboxylase] ligase [Bacteroidales bacterium]
MRFSQENSEHIFFERLDSTNDYLQKIIRDKNLSEGTVVWTNFQTHGKGHDKNTWESDEGKNLLMSILLKPNSFDATNQFQISRVISLALVDLVKKYCKSVTIKWPNDILVGKRKIAGILIENTILNNKISESIAGIGLNINQVNFPVYIPNPTSLKIEAGCQFDILNLLNDLIHHIENWYTRLLNMETQKLEKAYEDVLFGFNEILEFEETDRTFSAKIVGVGSGGQLKLEMPGGEIRKYGFKEVMYKL